MPQTLWVQKETVQRTNGSERSVPFSHVGPQFATPRELFPSHPNPVYPHLHQLLPQRTPPEYHCAKPSGTTRVKTTIKAKIKIKITRGFTFFQVIRRANKRAGNSIEVNGERKKGGDYFQRSHERVCGQRLYLLLYLSVFYPEILV